MTNGLIGRKLGMTRVFAEDGSAVPVTVIEAGPCRVVQVRTGAVQLGFGARRAQHRGGFALRLAIANLHRPGSPSPRIIVALGAGVTLLAAVAALASNLNQEVSLRLPTRAPSLYLIDIQPQQRADLEAILAETQGSRLVQLVPSLRARSAPNVSGTPAATSRCARWSPKRSA